jgi:ubiquitin-protein ligase
VKVLNRTVFVGRYYSGTSTFPAVRFHIEEETNASFFSQSDTSYAGGVFRLNIQFLTDYPLKPPCVKFTTRIYHPNVDSNGNISVDMLSIKWLPFHTIEKGTHAKG